MFKSDKLKDMNLGDLEFDLKPGGKIEGTKFASGTIKGGKVEFTAGNCSFVGTFQGPTKVNGTCKKNNEDVGAVVLTVVPI